MNGIVMQYAEERQMAFHKVKADEKTTLWPEVYDPETKIRIEYTTRDMPKNPPQTHVMIRRHENHVFGFDVVEDTVKHEGTRGYTTTHTGSLDKVLQGFQRGRHAFPEFNSESAFISYFSEGARLLFMSEQAIASMGAEYIFRLT
jgi:hypothetical protein